MQVSITGKQLDVSDALRGHIEGRLAAAVEKYFGNAIEAHVTVSRQGNRFRADCSVHVGHGIFELKYFFTSAIASSEGGEAHSAESVRHRIKKLIDGESPNLVLSDDKIVDILRDDDIDIARRTVAKYRDALRIPSSVQRRRQKKMLA